MRVTLRRYVDVSMMSIVAYSYIQIKEENTLELLKKKGSKFNAERQKIIAAEMDKIKQVHFVSLCRVIFQWGY